MLHNPLIFRFNCNWVPTSDQRK